jgi:hypothetical protein
MKEKPSTSQIEKKMDRRKEEVVVTTTTRQSVSQSGNQTQATTKQRQKRHLKEKEEFLNKTRKGVQRFTSPRVRVYVYACVHA